MPRVQLASSTRAKWVYLRNVHVRYGRNGANLEGFLRGGGPVRGRDRMLLLSTDLAPQSTSPLLKEAFRRKRAYEELKRSQLQELRAEPPAVGGER